MRKLVSLLICCGFLLVFLGVKVVARHGGRGGGHDRGAAHEARGVQVHRVNHTYRAVKGNSFVTKIKSLFVTTKSHQPYYNYNPPGRLTYKCYSCVTAASFPVYRGRPPVYVYRYRFSDNRYSDLVTGLALYNLGRSSESHVFHHQHYAPRHEEKCSMQIINRFTFEETSVPCYLLSTFVNNTAGSSKNLTATIDITSTDINNISQWLNASGPLLDVTPQMKCVLWRNLSVDKERHEASCALLQKYADTMRPPGVPMSVWLPLTLIAAVIVSFCQCCKNKKEKELEPLNGSTYTLYTK